MSILVLLCFALQRNHRCQFCDGLGFWARIFGKAQIDSNLKMAFSTKLVTTCIQMYIYIYNSICTIQCIIEKKKPSPGLKPVAPTKPARFLARRCIAPVWNGGSWTSTPAAWIEKWAASLLRFGFLRQDDMQWHL